MFRNNIIQPVNQFWFPEPDVRGAFLKVSDDEHLIFIALFTLNRPDVIIQMNGDVFPVVGDRFTAEQVQHSFQMCIRDRMRSKRHLIHETYYVPFRVEAGCCQGYYAIVL